MARAKKFDFEEFAEKIREEVRRLRPLVPDVAPHDLDLIVSRRLRPWGTGKRFFLRREGGHRVF